jgi:hypothetical protein
VSGGVGWGAGGGSYCVSKAAKTVTLTCMLEGFYTGAVCLFVV